MSVSSSDLNPAPRDPEHETPNDLLRLIRRALGYSPAEMADQLGLEGDVGAAQIRDMEQNKAVVTGPIERLVRLLVPGVELEVDADESAQAQQLIPRFLHCTDLEGESEVESIFHTRYPRFVGAIVAMPAEWREKFKAESVDVVPLAVEGSASLVVMWIDLPPETRDQTALLEDAARLALAYFQRRLRRT
jgi:transcriptional regulator with XRE-family HTH domain